jgi:hypothetical protein
MNRKVERRLLFLRAAIAPIARALSKIAMPNHKHSWILDAKAPGHGLPAGTSSTTN